MDIIYILNAIGLICDIIGVFFLYKYGLTAELISNIDTKKYPDNDNDKRSNYWIKYKSKLGFKLMIIGFFFQFASIIMQIAFNPPYNNSQNKAEKIKYQTCRCCCHCHYLKLVEQ